MIYFLAPKGRCGIENYIGGRWRRLNVPEIQCVAYEDAFTWETLPSGTWIFVGLEILPPAGKILAESVWQTLTDAGQKVLNRPKLLPSRHALIEAMFSAGINKFRSHVTNELSENIRYPVFVRQAEEHTGSMSELIPNRKALESFLRWQPLRGYKLSELLVIEFCDTVNELGEYRKYSAQCVQGMVTARHLHADTHWMVKAHSPVFRDEWAYEERKFIEDNSHAAEVKKIFDLANIEYGRIDYGLLSGKIQVWEINTNPTIGEPPQQGKAAVRMQEIAQLQEPARKLFFDRFQSMLEAIDSPYEPDVTVAVSLPPIDVQVWREEVETAQRLQRRREMVSKLTTWPPFERVRNRAKEALGAYRHK